LARFDRRGLSLGITERSELVPYALITARDPDDIQLEVPGHDRSAGSAPTQDHLVHPARQPRCARA